MPLPGFDSILAQIAYPGDTPAESNLLRAWLKDHGPKFDSIEWDVRLGEGVTPPPDLDPVYQEVMRRGTQLRADCIVHVDIYATIVEVKKRGGANAMGQLLAYRLLWMAMHPQRPEPYMVLVTSSVTAEVKLILEAHRITTYVVAPLEPIALY